jgi:hypothetical protein
VPSSWTRSSALAICAPKRRGQLRFTQQPGTRFTIGEQIGRKNFEGHFAFEAFIASAVNHTHPAFTKLLDDEIVRET